MVFACSSCAITCYVFSVSFVLVVNVCSLLCYFLCVLFYVFLISQFTVSVLFDVVIACYVFPCWFMCCSCYFLFLCLLFDYALCVDCLFICIVVVAVLFLYVFHFICYGLRLYVVIILLCSYLSCLLYVRLNVSCFNLFVLFMCSFP